MSVKLRFRRMGRKQLPVFGLVATDSRSSRDGRFIEDLGRYEPVAEPSTFKVNADRVIYWLGQGAQPSDTVRNLLQKEGVLLQWALTRQGKSEEEIETALTEFRERQQAKAGGAVKKTRAERRAEALQAERASAKEKAAELARERAEREAELQKQREEAEAAARAEAEQARAAAAADAADSEALTTAADAPAADAPAAGGDSETPEAAVTGEPVEQTSTQADGDDDTADQKAEAEAEGGTAAVEEASPEAVADEAPDAAEEQPAVTDATSPEVAADTGAAVADQTDAGAGQADTVTEEPATEAPDTAGTAGEEPAGDTPPAGDAEETAAPTAAADDLTAISGVGPTYSGILTGAGITTFAQLADASVEDIQKAISDAGSSSAGNEETWPEQARLLAAGDTAGHQAYVESLKS